MNCPLGAEYDSQAPWHQKEPHMVKCEACNGIGYHYYAYNFDTNRESECTETAYMLLPESEEEARRTRGHYVKGVKEICEVCDGVGEVEYEEDYEPDYDD